MKNAIKGLVLQALFTLAVTAGTFLLKPLTHLHGLCAWGFLPLCAMVSALFTVKRGVNAYLAWLLPPILFSAVEYAGNAGSLPSWSGGCMLLIAFCAVVGSAAGDVLTKRRKHK